MIAIVAVDKCWAIGNCGKLLFDLPKDRANFRTRTLGGTIIYGRKTLESLPNQRPLPGRRNIVLSRNPEFKVDDAEVAHSIDELKRMAQFKSDRTFVIGGEEIYRQLLPYCSHALVTKIFAVAPFAMQFFPEDLDFSPDWISHDHAGNVIDNGITCRTLYYQRISD